MCKVLRVTATTAVAMASLSCCAQRQPVAYVPPPPPIAYAPTAPVVHAPLPPAVGYEPPSPPRGYASAPPPVGYAPPQPERGYASAQPRIITSPLPSARYSNSPYARADIPPPADAHMVWRPSPRWATVKGKDCVAVKPDPQAKFKAAQAKATKIGVENLSKEDVEGLSLAQIKELRGY